MALWEDDTAGEAVPAATAVQAKLAALEQALAALADRQPAPDQPCPSPGLASLIAALRLAQGKLLASLLRAADAALAAGQPDQARAWLETLAGQAPQHPVLLACLDQDRDAPHRPALARVRALLAALPDQAAWADRPGEDNLRAALGLARFKAGAKAQARRLLARVRWDRLTRPEYLGGLLSPLYWSGAATEVARMVAADGLPRACADNCHPGSWLATSLGVFAALTGSRQRALAWLVPQVRGAVTSPPQLFQVFEGLLYADPEGELRGTLGDPDRLDRLWRRLDDEQRERLCGLLFNAGLIEEAGERFAALAGTLRPAVSPPLPRLVHGLMRCGRTDAADALVAAGERATAARDDPLELLPLAEALLHAGRIEAARRALDRLPDTGPPADALVRPLFVLRERLSQLEGMAALAPALFGTPRRLRYDTVQLHYALAFYDGALKEGYREFLDQTDRLPPSPVVSGTEAMYLFSLGRFEDLRARLADPMLAGEGPIAFLRLRLDAYLHLARGQYGQALTAFAALGHLAGKAAINLGNCQSLAPYVFEQALLLRFLGRRDEALSLARDCLRRYGAYANPCAPLAGLLERELAAAPPGLKVALACEQVADVCVMPQYFCQGWLYLQAAAIQLRCGRPGETTRLLRTRLARTLFLAKDRRQALATADGADLPRWREAIQAMFFPHFHDTFWNHLLDATFEDSRG